MSLASKARHLELLALDRSHWRLRGDKRPALIVGTNRSGTSFTGSMLGRATNAAYQREPIGWPILDQKVLTQAEVDRLPAADPPPRFVELADRAFSGRPSPAPQVTYWPTQFLRADTLLVKEVFPFSTLWLAQRYGARTLVILRHPAAIVASQHRKKWYGTVYDAFFTDVFDQHGITDEPARLALVIRLQEHAMMEAARVLGERALVLRYEDLVLHPVERLHAAADHLGLVWTARLESSVQAFSDGSAIANDHRDHVRESATRARAWAAELDATVLDRVRIGYGSIPGGGYEDDW